MVGSSRPQQLLAAQTGDRSGTYRSPGSTTVPIRTPPFVELPLTQRTHFKELVMVERELETLHEKLSTADVSAETIRRLSTLILGEPRRSNVFIYFFALVANTHFMGFKNPVTSIKRAVENADSAIKTADANGLSLTANALLLELGRIIIAETR